MENLKGKKVVVLGGSVGIGFSVAKAAAEEGAEVIIVSSNPERLNKALGRLPANAKSFTVDLASERQIATLFTTIGHFDHLVFTAGETLQLGNVADTNIDVAKNFFNVRYWGAFLAVQYAAGNINAGGSITLTGGSAAKRPGTGWGLGASICAAMEGFTRAMAVELAPIRVNIVVPGLVKTNLWANMTTEAQDGMFSHFSEKLPVKYVAGPDDIALTYLYLMRQPYGTGQAVVVDGGYVLV
ncbi:NAD(P)-dependent dehydrogenase (short-subunit alcohol dehydrogenase family) [Mucilaginibacter oryzae]|uniref:NAD(P)-dependent dehydrogenase (Short-subunit alcohol dehydrogenase family) n=1 Tax=Mucilaginibacter oryzae TaxID=468058 RepID=A0A316H5Z7_9SPHI|nr:SDR family oxidoreductase [Mucilaginibacter oryzae]PWK75837.1 NAD(P)-dependent dehydrogenase (short-subunit alcohol dehydrogenase family) [Mucilaginibacter oryzae]